MKGIKTQPEIELQIDLNVTSYIPDEYIEDSNQKIEIYQNIAIARTEEDIQNVIDEIIDRYGEMPEEVNNLLEVARIKSLAKKAFVTKINQRRESVVFNFDANNFNMEIIDKLVKKYKNEIKFSRRN